MDTPLDCCAPVASPALAAGDAEAAATLFKALSDPTRVRIVNLLANHDGPVCVCELTAQLPVSQPTMSCHLKKLVMAGLLTREQRGTWAFFSLRPDAMQRLSETFLKKEVLV